MHERILLFSGGLDSLVSWFLLDRPRPVFFQIAQSYQQAEVETIALLERKCEGMEVQIIPGLPLGWQADPRNGYIPLRNPWFIWSVNALWQPDVIYLNALRGEASLDKSGRFFRQTNRTFAYLGHPARIIAPFRKLTKTGLLRLFLEKFPSQKDLVYDTFSCFNYDELNVDYAGCGDCGACFRRWVALTNNGLHESYEKDPAEWARNTLENKKGYIVQSLLKSDVLEWPSILVNNLEARRALQTARGIKVG